MSCDCGDEDWPCHVMMRIGHSHNLESVAIAKSNHNWRMPYPGSAVATLIPRLWGLGRVVM